MALAKMKHLHVLGKLVHREAILHRLQELGFVELESGALPSTQWDYKRSKREEGDLEREIADLNGALSMMERFHRRKPTFIQQFSGIKTGMTTDQYQNYLAQEERAGSIIQRCRDLEAAWTKLENNLTALNGRIEELTPWLKLDIPLAALEQSGAVRAILVKVSPRHKRGLGEALAEIDGPAVYVEEIGVEKTSVNWFMIFHEKVEAQVTKALSEKQASLIELGKEDATPREIVGQLVAEKERLTTERESLRREIAGIVQERPLLQALHDAKTNRLARIRKNGELPCSERTFYLEGWLMAKDLGRLHRAIEDIDPVTYIEARDPLPEENVPVDFANHPLIRPFEVIVQVYGYPKYGEIDPTPSMAPFFFIFFGITLADVGYGAFLSALCWYLLHHVKMAGMGKKLFQMLFLGGLSSMAFGFLMSGYFGDLLPVPALWFNPTEDPNRLLVVALILGAIQLYLGIIIKAFMRIREGQPGEAFRNELLWLLFLTSLFLLLGGGAIGLGKYQSFLNILALFSTVAVVIGKSAGAGTFVEKVKRLPGSLFSLYDAVNFFSDLLSYSRLLALGLSSAIIGQVVNYFVRLFKPGITNPIGLLAGLAVFLFGHLLNLLLGALSSYVHSSRLQYIEYFGKFYEAGGRPFRPFSKKYDYIELDEEGEA